MKRLGLFIMCMLAVFSLQAVDMKARGERKAVLAGNEAYRAGNYAKALQQYESALKLNPASVTALFNKSLAATQLAKSMPEGKDKEKAEMLASASEGFEQVAKHTSDNPELAARANYNLGNVNFDAKKYEEAITYYKNALRLNPGDDKARRNLRIAQLNLPKQPQNKKQNQQNNKDKNKNQDKDKDQDKDKNKDQNKDKDKDKDKNKNQNPQQQKPQKQDMNKQAADRILKRSTDKENETRRKMTIGAPNGRKKGW